MTCERNSITENLETPRRRKFDQKNDILSDTGEGSGVIDGKWLEKSAEGAKINGWAAGRWKNDICSDLIDMAIEFPQQ